MSETKKIPRQFKIFTDLMNLEGSIQLWKCGIQAFERSKGRRKDYYGTSIKYHNNKIELLAASVNIKGSVEEIASSEIPLIKELLDYPPYLEYLKKPEEREWKECDDSSRRSHHPYYI